MKDGIIRVDTKRGKVFGFTSDKFEGDSYLWKGGEFMWVSFIVSRTKGRGYFSSLVKQIKAQGFKVAVPTPLGQMPSILQHLGFRPTLYDSKEFGAMEVWVNDNNNLPEGIKEDG
jgi:hypothetical protein